MPTSAVGLPIGEEFDVAHFDKRRSSLRNEFSEYREHYSEIAAFFAPRSGFHLKSNQSSSASPIRGTKQHKAIIDSTTIRVSRNAAAGLQAGITSPSRPWKRLGPDDPSLNDEHGARAFYAELDKRFDHILNQTNFYQSCLQGYGDYVKYGPAAIQIDEHEEDVFRCIVHPIGSWVAAKNSDGIVDVFYKDQKVTGHELIGKFGEDAIDETFKQEIRLNPYSRHDLRNAIEPNPYYREGIPAIGIASFKFVSVWWVAGREKKFLKIHGYHEFPVMVFNMYRTDQSDVYGYGAGLEGLGDAKQLQHMQRMKLRGIDKMVDPAMQAPSALAQVGLNTVPGETNYHDSPQKIESIYNVNLPLQYVYEDIDATQQRLRESFFEDLFLMINTSINRQTTAREIEERHQEKLVMLGPVLESLITDWLNPSVKRILAIMRRANMWPEAPESLVGHDFTIEYVSILATAQRAVQTIAIEQGLNFVSQAKQFGFEMMADRIDQDGVFDAYMDRIGFPPEGIVELGDAEKTRAARAQMLQQDRQMQMAQQGAAAAADASKADMTQPNVLTQLLGQVAA